MDSTHLIWRENSDGNWRLKVACDGDADEVGTHLALAAVEVGHRVVRLDLRDTPSLEESVMESALKMFCELKRVDFSSRMEWDPPVGWMLMVKKDRSLLLREEAVEQRSPSLVEEGPCLDFRDQEKTYGSRVFSAFFKVLVGEKTKLLEELSDKSVYQVLGLVDLAVTFKSAELLRRCDEALSPWVGESLSLQSKPSLIKPLYDAAKGVLPKTYQALMGVVASFVQSGTRLSMQDAAAQHLNPEIVMDLVVRVADECRPALLDLRIPTWLSARDCLAIAAKVPSLKRVDLPQEIYPSEEELKKPPLNCKSVWVYNGFHFYGMANSCFKNTCPDYATGWRALRHHVGSYLDVRKLHEVFGLDAVNWFFLRLSVGEALAWPRLTVVNCKLYRKILLLARFMGREDIAREGDKVWAEKLRATPFDDVSHIIKLMHRAKEWGFPKVCTACDEGIGEFVGRALEVFGPTKDWKNFIKTFARDVRDLSYLRLSGETKNPEKGAPTDEVLAFLLDAFPEVSRVYLDKWPLRDRGVNLLSRWQGLNEVVLKGMTNAKNVMVQLRKNNSIRSVRIEPDS